jgi:DNA-binding CsgD family transcriptional regulator
MNTSDLPSTDPAHRSPALEIQLMRAALDQVDYGLAVVHADTRELLFANDPAQTLLRAVSGNFRLQAGHIEAQDGEGHNQLHVALQATKVGRRSLLALHGPRSAGNEIRAADTVAIMPLGIDGHALLVFSKTKVCDTTTLTLFARERGLTGAEGQVLARVCKGLSPQQIAVDLGVQISTIRTQLRAIRQKTAADSLRQLVEMVSRLPPVAVRLTAHPVAC